MERSGDNLSVSKMVEHAAPLAAPAKLNRVPLAGVAGKGSCDPGAAVGGDAPAAGEAADGEGSGDDAGDRAAGEAADDALGENATGKIGEGAAGEAEALAGLAIGVIIGDDALAPAAISATAHDDKLGKLPLKGAYEGERGG